MLFFKPSRVIPNTTIFTELSPFSGAGNMDTNNVVKSLENVRYFVGDDNGQVVVANEAYLPPLERGMRYQ